MLENTTRLTSNTCTFLSRLYFSINQFQVNFPILFPLKMSENLCNSDFVILTFTGGIEMGHEMCFTESIPTYAKTILTYLDGYDFLNLLID